MDEIFLTKLADIARFQFQASRVEDAEASCRTLLQHAPNHLEASYLLARILLCSGRHEEALGILAPMLTLSPDLTFVANDCREAFVKSSQAAEGAVLFRELSDGNPGLDNLLINLGLLYNEAHRPEEAAACFNDILAREPEHGEALFLLAQNAISKSHFIEAQRLIEKAASLAPTRPDILNVYAGVLKTIGRAGDADGIYFRAVELNPEDTRLYSNYLMNLICTERSPEYAFEKHLIWARDKTAPYAPHTNPAQPTRRLRIGYVSADFRAHPVAFFIEPILSLHDSEQVEVYCYAQIEEADFITEQFRSRNLVWRPITDLSDPEAAKLIREDGIDILIDLNGHTASSRLLLFALRPAPIQMTWLGYAHSTGLASIDYRITDLVADPPGLTEHLHSERLYRLKGSFICYHPPQDPPPVTDPPFATNGYVTFGAFNNMAKWTPGMLDLWSSILREVPQSRLMLKVAGLEGPGMRTYVEGLFAERGVEAERLVLQGRVPTVIDHLHCFGQVDVALDSFPYNGTTTTCESLYMGVPVITLSGRSHVSRVGASILAASGLEELIAGTPERYLEAAVALARDEHRLRSYREGLRDQVSKSAFFQVAQFTLNLEAAYRDIWQKWCETQQEALEP